MVSWSAWRGRCGLPRTWSAARPSSCRRRPGGTARTSSSTEEKKNWNQLKKLKWKKFNQTKLELNKSHFLLPVPSCWQTCLAWRKREGTWARWGCSAEGCRWEGVSWQAIELVDQIFTLLKCEYFSRKRLKEYCHRFSIHRARRHDLAQEMERLSNSQADNRASQVRP